MKMDGPTLSLRTDEGANAIDVTTLVAMLSGRGVVSGGEVHDGSAPFTVQVMATNGWFASSEAAVGESEIDGDTTIGTAVQRGSATVDLREYVDETYPRKVLVCLPRDPTGNAASGDYHVVAGQPAQAKPADFSEPWQTSEPALPDLNDRPDLIPLAAGWIDANADEIVEGDLWQRQQRPDAALRELWASELHIASLIDGAGDTHSEGLADASDVTDAAIRKAINTDSGHAQDAPHDYLTPDEARGAVRGDVDVAELSGAAGTDGQLPFSTGSVVNWSTPPDEWGSLQALVDAAAAAGVTPSFDAIDVDDLNIMSGYSWPDGTGGTTSPSAQAGNVALLADLGDVQRGAYADRHAPDGSGDIYFAETGATRGVFHDDPANSPAAWSALAIHPADIDAGDLGFNPATQQELNSHTDRTDNPHNVTAAQSAALPENGTASAADSAATAAKASALIDSEAGGGSTVTSDQLARSDTDDDIAGTRTHKQPAESIHGERSQDEVERWVGSDTDVLRYIDVSSQEAYNAYYDGQDWRYLVPDVPAVRTTMASAGEYHIHTAPPSLSGEVVNWQTATVSEGSIGAADHAAEADRLSSSGDWRVEGQTLYVFADADSKDAIDYAKTNDLTTLRFAPGTYRGVSVPAGFFIKGESSPLGERPVIFNGGGGHALDLQGGGCRVSSVRVQSDETHAMIIRGRNNSIEDCFAKTGDSGFYFASAENSALIGCRTDSAQRFDGDGVFFDGSSYDNTVTSGYGLVSIGGNTGDQEIGVNVLETTTNYDNELAIIGETDGGITDYRVEAVGYVYDVQLSNEDDIGEKYVQGSVNGGMDIIGYNGALKGIAFGPNTGEYRLKRNGQEVEPFHLNARVLEIRTAADKAPYEIAVSDRLIGTAETTQEDHIFGDGKRAIGSVASSGLDTWFYTGVLQGIDSNHDLMLTVDGEERTVPGVVPTGVVSYNG